MMENPETIIITTKTKLVTGALESRQGGRSENQDFVGYADVPAGFLLVLCDGMGGGPGGRTASTKVVESVVRHMSSLAPGEKPDEAISKAIAGADALIASIVQENPQLMGMGTTICVLLITPKSAIAAHVGDSRIYQFRSKQKVFRSADHSQVGELVRNGTLTEEQARLSSNSNIITRAINGRGIAQPDIVELPYEQGDRFILCTDGIWGQMPETELIKKSVTARTPAGAVVQLVCDADNIGKAEGNMHDNLTVASVDTLCNSKLKVQMGRKARQIIISLATLLAISIVLLVYILAMSIKKDARLEAQSGQVETLQQENRQLTETNRKYKKTCDDMQQQLNSAKSENLAISSILTSMNKALEQMHTVSNAPKTPAASTPTPPEARPAPAKPKVTEKDIAIKKLENWSKSNGIIKEEDIRVVKGRLNTANCNVADKSLNRAINVMSKNSMSSQQKEQAQKKAFKEAIEALRKNNN